MRYQDIPSQESETLHYYILLKDDFQLFLQYKFGSEKEESNNRFFENYRTSCFQKIMCTPVRSQRSMTSSTTFFAVRKQKLSVGFEPAMPSPQFFRK